MSIITSSVSNEALKEHTAHRHVSWHLKENNPFMDILTSYCSPCNRMSFCTVHLLINLIGGYYCNLGWARFCRNECPNASPPPRKGNVITTRRGAETAPRWPGNYKAISLLFSAKRYNAVAEALDIFQLDRVAMSLLLSESSSVPIISGTRSPCIMRALWL